MIAWLRERVQSWLARWWRDDPDRWYWDHPND